MTLYHKKYEKKKAHSPKSIGGGLRHYCRLEAMP